jgi:hypothetical protein
METLVKSQIIRIGGLIAIAPHFMGLKRKYGRFYMDSKPDNQGKPALDV